MRIVDSLLMEIDQEAQTTKRVLDRIPEDNLTWKPHPKSYSLGQLGLHIASLQGRVAAAAAQDTFEAPSFSQAEPKSRQEILDAFAKSLASAKETLNKMDDARLMSMWSLTKNGKVLMTIPRIGFVRSILMNHNYHHRGQLSVYLRMLDVPVPSIYGPSADEKPFG
ncbi:MAG: DinB family protein [Candidatus Acidiferrales bacterium]